MVTKKLCISLSESDFKYLMEDDMLSASKIFQVALHNIMQQRHEWDNRIDVLQNKIRVMQARIFELEGGPKT